MSLVVDILALFWLRYSLGYFLKNWAFFPKTSGHPGTMLAIVCYVFNDDSDANYAGVNEALVSFFLVMSDLVKFFSLSDPLEVCSGHFPSWL